MALQRYQLLNPLQIVYKPWQFGSIFFLNACTGRGKCLFLTQKAEEIQSTYLKSDRIKSLLNRVIKWEISDVQIYKVRQERKGERKEAVSSLSVVSRALT